MAQQKTMSDFVIKMSSAGNFNKVDKEVEKIKKKAQQTQKVINKLQADNQKKKTKKEPVKLNDERVSEASKYLALNKLVTSEKKTQLEIAKMIADVDNTKGLKFMDTKARGPYVKGMKPDSRGAIREQVLSGQEVGDAIAKQKLADKEIAIERQKLEKVGSMRSTLINRDKKAHMKKLNAWGTAETKAINKRKADHMKYLNNWGSSESKAIKKQAAKKKKFLNDWGTAETNAIKKQHKVEQDTWANSERLRKGAIEQTEIHGKMIRRNTDSMFGFGRAMGSLSIMFFAQMVSKAMQRVLTSVVGTFRRIAGEKNILNQGLTALAANFEYLKFSIGNAIATALEPLLPVLIPIIEAMADWVQQNPYWAAWGIILLYIGSVVAGLAAQLFLLAAGIMNLAGFKTMGAMFAAGGAKIVWVIKGIGKAFLWLGKIILHPVKSIKLFGNWVWTIILAVKTFFVKQILIMVSTATKGFVTMGVKAGIFAKLMGAAFALIGVAVWSMIAIMIVAALSFENTRKTFMDAFGAIWGALKQVVASFNYFGGTVKKTEKDNADSVSGIYKAWAWIANYGVLFVSGVAASLSLLVKGIGAVIHAIIGTVAAGIAGFLLVLDVVVKGLATIVNGILSLLLKALQAVGAGNGKIAKGIKSFQNFNDGVSDSLHKAALSVTEFAGEEFTVKIPLSVEATEADYKLTENMKKAIDGSYARENIANKQYEIDNPEPDAMGDFDFDSLTTEQQQDIERAQVVSDEGLDGAARYNAELEKLNTISAESAETNALFGTTVGETSTIMAEGNEITNQSFEEYTSLHSTKGDNIEMMFAEMEAMTELAEYKKDDIKLTQEQTAAVNALMRSKDKRKDKSKRVTAGSLGITGNEIARMIGADMSGIDY